MSLLTAIKDAILGNFVFDEVEKQRLALCNNCNSKRGGTCVKCGCFISLKVQFPDEFCPIGKWHKSETE